MSIFSKMHAKQITLTSSLIFSLSCSYGSFWGWIKLPPHICHLICIHGLTWLKIFGETLWEEKKPNSSKFHPWPIYACCFNASSSKLIWVKMQLREIIHSNNQMTLLFISISSSVAWLQIILFLTVPWINSPNCYLKDIFYKC